MSLYYHRLIVIRPQSEILVPAAIKKDLDPTKGHHEAIIGPPGSTKQLQARRRLVTDGSTDSGFSIEEGEVTESEEVRYR